LQTIADVRSELAESAVTQYGWGTATDDWRSVVEDPSIGLFDNAAPNDLHVEPCIAAAERGKHILCEKPLARSAAEAHRIWRAADEAGVLHLCAFMYRFIPAIRHARDLIHAGELGEVVHFRSTFLLGFALDETIPMSWRFDRRVAGAGALGDLGSHHIDLARFLVGEVERIAANTKTFIEDRPGGRVTNDDAFVSIAELSGGATATFEGSRVAGNHALTSRIEVDGTKGSLAFSFERLNELELSQRGQPGFRRFLVTQPGHPYADFWFPVGIQGQHPISWADCFAHQAHCITHAIATGSRLPEHAPTFRDGYRVAEVVDAATRAVSSRGWEDVHYRD
jgi:predicted dehydrogenase